MAHTAQSQCSAHPLLSAIAQRIRPGSPRGTHRAPLACQAHKELHDRDRHLAVQPAAAVALAGMLESGPGLRSLMAAEKVSPLQGEAATSASGRAASAHGGLWARQTPPGGLI